MLDTPAPKYYEPSMSAESQSAIDNIKGGALGATRESELGAYTPTTSARGLLNDTGSFDRGLAYGQDPVLAAIRQRSQRGFDVEERRQNFETKLNARNSYFDRLANASNLAAQENQMNFQKEMAKRRAKEAKKAARGQTIGAVLGIGGAVVGGIYGGPMGAMAGAQGGAAVGNAVGGGLG